MEEGQPLVILDATTVASLERAIAQAQVVLRNAEDDLAEAQNPHTPLDLAQAVASVANAMLAEKNAQESLDAVRDGPIADDVAKGQSQVDAANISLANSQGDLKLTLKEWDGNVQEAEDASDDGLTRYQGVFEKWLGIDLGEEDVNIAPDTLLDSRGVDLDAIFDRGLRFQDINKGVQADGVPLFDDPATSWSEPTVYNWLHFYPGAIAPTCGDGGVSSQEVCISGEMQAAWDTYQEAKDSLDTVQTQAAKATANANAALTKAEESLAAAQEALADLQAGIDSLEIDVKEKQLVVAQATLAEAEKDLVELLGSVDPLEVSLLEADVAVAQLALETATQRLDGGTIHAPTAGVVSLVNREAGQSVNANTTII